MRDSSNVRTRSFEAFNGRALVSKLFSIALFLSGISASMAGTTNTSPVPVLGPGQIPQQLVFPPIGSGDTPMPLTQGDAPNTNQPPPSGSALGGFPGGSKFQQQPEAARSIVNILSDVSDPQPTFGLTPLGGGRPQPGGQHTVLTFRPGTLTSTQLSQIQSTLGWKFSPSSSYQNITATTSEIDKLQEILYPHPDSNKRIPNGPNTAKRAERLTFYTKPGFGYPKRTPTPWFVYSSAVMF